MKDQIQNLLPGAMTAGLSHAYEKKRKTEEIEHTSAAKQFTRAIQLLSLSSVIPVAFSLYFISTGTSLATVIQDLPNFASALIPLYIPLLWLAITANKRAKLAKRLIEEYSHKEVLSKTFEGLHSRVESLDNKESAKDLRIRLLYNIVSVCSENPGKLISDFSSSDHPIVEVVDKSILLSDSVAKLKGIPGFDSVFRAIEKKHIAKLAKTSSLVADGLDTQTNLESLANEEKDLV